MPCDSFLRYVFTFHLLQDDSNMGMNTDDEENGPGSPVKDGVEVSKGKFTHLCLKEILLYLLIFHSS